MATLQTTFFMFIFPFVTNAVTSKLFVKKQSPNSTQLANHLIETANADSMVTCAANCAKTTGARCRSVIYYRDISQCTVYDVLWSGSGAVDPNLRYYAMAGILADMGGTWLEFNTPYRASAVNYGVVDLAGAGIDLSGRTGIVFKVKAANDGHVLLHQDRTNLVDNVIEIVLGGFSNTQSVLRNSQQGPTRDSYIENNIITGSEYRYFWVSYVDGTISVGKGDLVGATQIMTWVMNPVHVVNYISVGIGYGSDGYWSFQTGSVLLLTKTMAY